MAENETQVKCGIGDCGKTFPAGLSETHYEQAHAVQDKQKALSQMKPTNPSTKKVELVEPEAKATVNVVSTNTTETKSTQANTTSNEKKDNV